MFNIISCQGNANQNHNEIPLHIHIIKRQIITSICKYVEKLEASLNDGGNGKWCTTVKNRLSGSFSKC